MFRKSKSKKSRRAKTDRKLHHRLLPYFFLFTFSFLLRRRRGLRLAAAVTPKNAGGGELAQLVPNHVFRDEQLEKLIAIVDFKGMPNEIRYHRTIT